MRQIAFGASLQSFAIVMTVATDVELEIGELRFKGWTLQKVLSPGILDERLTQKEVWLARSSQQAPKLLYTTDVKTIPRPVVSKTKQAEDSYVLRICCDLRFIAKDAQSTVKTGPGHCFRLWLSELDSHSRDMILHVGDTWGFHEVQREHLIRGMVRIKGHDRAMKMLKASGTAMKGQVWFVDPIKWDMFTNEAPRMVWIDQKPNEPALTFVKRVATDAGPYGMARGRVQLALRVPPTDTRLGPRLATWQISAVPRQWDLEHVVETVEQLGFEQVDVQAKNRHRHGTTSVFRAVRSDDRDQLQLHFDATDDESPLDLFVVKQSKVRKPGVIVPLRPERDVAFAIPDVSSKGKGKGEGKSKGKSKGAFSSPDVRQVELADSDVSEAGSLEHDDMRDKSVNDMLDNEAQDVGVTTPMDTSEGGQGTKRKEAPKVPKASPEKKKQKPVMPASARRVPNAGGGNCLYHALAQAESKPGKLRSHRQLRAFLSSYLGKHSTKFEPYWDHKGPDDQPFSGDFSAYLAAMAKDKAWGGYMDIGAYAEATSRPVLVVHPQSDNVHGFHLQGKAEAVCLVYEQQHYELLLCNDQELQKLWQKAEDGGFAGYRGAAKSVQCVLNPVATPRKSLKAAASVKSVRLSDFASEQSMCLSDFGPPKAASSRKRKSFTARWVLDAQLSPTNRVCRPQSLEAPLTKPLQWIVFRGRVRCARWSLNSEAHGEKKSLWWKRNNHLNYRHKGVDKKTVQGFSVPTEICEISMFLPSHAIGWKCPWCPACLPKLDRHAQTAAVKRHWQKVHPRRCLKDMQKARWKANDPVLTAVRAQADVRLIASCQKRRNEKCRGHDITPLRLNWNEWPRRCSRKRDALGRRMKAKIARAGTFLTCTKCWRSGNMNNIAKVQCSEEPPVKLHVATRAWWKKLLTMGSKNPAAIARAWSTTVSRVSELCGLQVHNS